LYFSIPWHDISLALYDAEGFIMQKDWFPVDVILLLLKFSLSTYEHCVWIYPGAVTDVEPLAHPVRGRKKQEAATKRFWIFVCHRGGVHWALAIYDQVKGHIFFFDSLLQGDEVEERRFISHVWVVIHGSSEIPPPCANPTIFLMRCPKQQGKWECGLWVLEFTRFFFQEIHQGTNVLYQKRWRLGRMYQSLSNLKLCQEKMISCWLGFIREVMGNHKNEPLHPVGLRYRDIFDCKPFAPPPWPVDRPPQTPVLAPTRPLPPKTPTAVAAALFNQPPSAAATPQQLDEDMDIDAFVTEAVIRLEEVKTPTRKRNWEGRVQQVRDLQAARQTTKAIKEIKALTGVSTPWREQADPLPLFDNNNPSPTLSVTADNAPPEEGSPGSPPRKLPRLRSETGNLRPQTPEGWVRPPTYDHTESPDNHLAPEHPPWFEGWAQLKQERAEWLARQEQRERAPEGQSILTREERMRRRHQR
jgi:hypothetical protein